MGRSLEKRIPHRNDNASKKRTQKTQLSEKINGGYGKSHMGNVGGFQGSAVRAIIFTIYLDDMLEDYQALSRHMQLPTRQEKQRSAQSGTKELLNRIRDMLKNRNRIAKTTNQRGI